jgi:CheY-like chemotaxis protein
MIENSILFISADLGAASRIKSILRDRVEAILEWYPVETLFEGLRAIQGWWFDLILRDLFLPSVRSLATLRHAPTTPVIALVHSQDRDTTVTAVRQGASDFFCYEDSDPASLQRAFAGALKGPDSASGERRTKVRFTCRLTVSYQTLKPPFLSGQGTSKNISSKGLVFTSNEEFQPGQSLQVSLDWPARLENQVRLRLIAAGRIVRSVNGQTAMTIDKYEFRTRRAAADLSASP